MKRWIILASSVVTLTLGAAGGYAYFRTVQSTKVDVKMEWPAMSDHDRELFDIAAGKYDGPGHYLNLPPGK